jgi:hypothetical protein
VKVTKIKSKILPKTFHAFVALIEYFLFARFEVDFGRWLTSPAMFVKPSQTIQTFDVAALRYLDIY